MYSPPGQDTRKLLTFCEAICNLTRSGLVPAGTRPAPRQVTSRFTQYRNYLILSWGEYIQKNEARCRVDGVCVCVW